MSVQWRLRAADAAPCADTDGIGPGTDPDIDAEVSAVCVGELPDDLSAGFLAGVGFTGTVGQVLQLPGAGAGPVRVLLGLGPRDELGAAAVRTAAALLARALTRHRRITLHAPLQDLRPLAEGYLLGGYRFAGHRSRADRQADQHIDVVPAPPQPPTAPRPPGTEHQPGTIPPLRSGDPAAGLAAGVLIGEAVLLARDLVNEPGQSLTPQLFAERATLLAKSTGLSCEIWDEDRIAAERLGGLAGVARGSLVPPRLVRLGYRPPVTEGRAPYRVALVGKGVTYDAGGLSLKPNAQLADMKADMAGAAAVLCAMAVLRGLDCPVAVDGWLPLTENMPNADPTRVGDVLVIRDGTTVEVRNADAEGRLILADALVLAAETRPDAIIDVATLTDAAAVALGRRIAAVLGTDRTLVERLIAAGERSGEPCWPLPLPEVYRRQLNSRVADLVNYTIGTRHGTALLAGLFLREFVPADIPWAHLDIQGTALCDADEGEWSAGATGFGVRTLVEFLTGGAAVPRTPR
jgi:leucyl aminopeptidase